MPLTEFDGAIDAVDWTAVDDAWRDPADLARRLRDVAYAADGREALTEVVERLANSRADLAEHAWRAVEPLVRLLEAGGGTAGAAAILDALWSFRASAAADDEPGWGPGEEGFSGGQPPPAEPYDRDRACRRVREALDANRSCWHGVLVHGPAAGRATAGALLGRSDAMTDDEWSALADAANDEHDSVQAATMAVYAAVHAASSSERYERLLDVARGEGPRAAMTAVGLAWARWRDELRAVLHDGLAIGRLDPHQLRWSAGVVADACAEALTRFDPDYDSRSAAAVGNAYAQWAAAPDPDDASAPWPVARRVGQWYVLRGLASHRGTAALVERRELDPRAREVLHRVDSVGPKVVLPALLHCGIAPRPGHLGRYLDGPDGPLDRRLRGPAPETEHEWPVWKWLMVGELLDPLARRTWPEHVGALLAAQCNADELLALAEDLASDGYGLAHYGPDGRPKRSREPQRAVAHAVRLRAADLDPLIPSALSVAADPNRIELLARPWVESRRDRGLDVPADIARLVANQSR